MIDGKLLHGHLHPEMGHIRIPRNRQLDPFPGSCPYHGDCLEGLVASRALEARSGKSPHLVADDDPIWTMVIEHLAMGLTNWICTLSPEKIILGGGIMQRTLLFPLLRSRATELLGGYVDSVEIVPPGLGSRAGVLGALALAEAACTPKLPAAS